MSSFSCTLEAQKIKIRYTLRMNVVHDGGSSRGFFGLGPSGSVELPIIIMQPPQQVVYWQHPQVAPPQNWSPQVVQLVHYAEPLQPAVPKADNADGSSESAIDQSDDDDKPSNPAAASEQNVSQMALMS